MRRRQEKTRTAPDRPLWTVLVGAQEKKGATETARVFWESVSVFPSRIWVEVWTVKAIVMRPQTDSGARGPCYNGAGTWLHHDHAMVFCGRQNLGAIKLGVQMRKCQSEAQQERTACFLSASTVNCGKRGMALRGSR